jgi:hypothetical protein
VVGLCILLLALAILDVLSGFSARGGCHGEPTF